MSTRRRAARAGLLLLTGGLAGLAAGQAPPRRPPTFGTGVDMIRLNVSVTDSAARYVTGLSEKDFAVYEDGKPQQLSFFAPDPQPTSLSLLIDCSASMEEKLITAQEAGVRFIRTLGERDFGQVIQFNDRTSVLQDFTGDHAALESAIRSTRASGPTALYTALYVALKGLAAHGEDHAPRRQAIVLLSDGEDTVSSVGEDQVMSVAREMNTAIYSIGLQPDRPGMRESTAVGRATYFLTALARETGGQVYFPRLLSELDSVYGRIVEDLRTQYTLGYVSANARRDGVWHKIVVLTPTRESLQVRHRIGYQVPKG